MSAIALHIKPIFLLSGFRSPVVTSLILFRRKRYVLSRNRTTSSTSTSTRRVTRIFAMAESDSRVSSLSGCDNDKVFKSVDQAYCEIIVVRHGETEWNADGRIQGHLDVDLNDAGRQQAVAVADRLSKEAKISVVYSSDLKRALDTAQIIAKSCGGLEVITDADLRERHLGDLQGLVYSELNKSCPAAYKALLSHHSDQKIPGGGESLDQLFDRCTNSLERIGRQHRGERVVVVTHGGVLRELYKWACPTKMPGRKVLNTCVNIFHFSEEDQWILKTWGDVSHLDQTGYLDSGFGGDRTSG